MQEFRIAKNPLADKPGRYEVKGYWLTESEEETQNIWERLLSMTLAATRELPKSGLNRED